MGSSVSLRGSRNHIIVLSFVVVYFALFKLLVLKFKSSFYFSTFVPWFL